MKSLARVICVVLVLLLIVGSALGIATDGFKRSITDIFKKPEASNGSGITDGEGNEIGSGVYEMPSLINFSALAFEQAYAEGKSAVEFSLTATVLPEDATNRLVDWSVSWSDGYTSPSVTEYLSVTPSYDGSRQVVVRCFKAFEKDINITVTTRQNNCVATCVAHYVGTATALSIEFDGVQKDSDGNYIFTTFGDYSTTIKAVSGFGDNISTENMEFEYFLEDSPNAMVQMIEIYKYSDSFSNITKFVKDGPYAKSCMLSEVFKFQDQNRLYIENNTFRASFSGWYSSFKRIEESIDGYSYYLYAPLTSTYYEDLSEYYKSQGQNMPGGANLILARLNENLTVNFLKPLTVRIVEKNSGLSTSFSFKFLDSKLVNSVVLSNSELTF